MMYKRMMIETMHGLALMLAPFKYWLLAFFGALAVAISVSWFIDEKPETTRMTYTYDILTVEDILKSYHSQIDQGSASVDDYLKLAKLYQSLNQSENALSIYHQALERFSNDSQLNYHLARLYYQKQQIKVAIKHGHRALNLAPKRPEYYLLLAKLYQDTDPMRASSLLQQALDLNISNGQIIVELIELLIEHQQVERAVNLYKSTLAQNPEYIYLFKPVIIALRKANTPQHLLCQVLDFAATYLEAKDKVLLLELGYQYTQIGQFPKAMASYERAAEL